MTVNIKELIRTIPDYPKPGIMFRDITTLLEHPEGFRETINQLVEHCKNIDFDVIVGLEARGFIIGAAMAYAMNKGFIPIRKKGKLPGKVKRKEYNLEYGTDTIEIHTDAVKPGEKILVVDDLLATGGTCLGAISLLEELGAIVQEFVVVIDLPDLPGGKRLREKGVKFFKLIDFEGD
ncbi:MAG: adenine phosphoribosyltransferase [Bacteriovoracaceae bacterium]|nr:adenine phosphoribosyltransferase [Bacteriovoracaceae bacterium]